ncbi:hypothetical protein EQU24_11890 [Methylotuvimicrobium buryatense]|uniref:Uncharacterized protein n=1 Tax=Methylotuvimicrobium buryatense TaxID=95641 RepID=A0A4P9USZ4_METBY|nr:hypothetical protein EQU24_11890 [Methylotuvimicrobium buryatense]
MTVSPDYPFRVARMERSAIREVRSRAVPYSATLHTGYMARKNVNKTCNVKLKCRLQYNREVSRFHAYRHEIMNP